MMLNLTCSLLISALVFAGASSDGASSHRQLRSQRNRELPGAGSTFFLNWEGEGDNTYEIDDHYESGPFNSWATISNIPAGYTQQDFTGHRSGYIITYTIHGFEPLSTNKITFGFAETYGPNCEVGKRLLDTTINGLGHEFAIDTYAAVGCNAAHTVSGSFPADMKGDYVIHIGASVGDSMISTIDIKPAIAPEYRSGIIINSKYPNDGAVYDIIGDTAIFGTYEPIANLGAYTRALFKDMRSGISFSYFIKGFVPGSTKIVTLGFAEYFDDNCAIGKRVFDVMVNGVVFAEDLDVYKEAGDCFTGYTITKTIQVDLNGNIELNFEASKEKAMISFIHVVPEFSEAPTMAPISSETLAPTPQPTPKCWSPYTCPANSLPNADSNGCPWSHWGCECIENYQKDVETGTCVDASEEPPVPICWSPYTCPANSLPNADSNGCPWSIWDCECEEGLVRDISSESCISEEEPQEPICWSPYTCPANSLPNADSNGCPWSIWDCECEEGLVRDISSESCISEEEPQEPICWSSFECPANAEPNADSNGCPWSIWDCECEEGLERDGDSESCI